MTKLVLGRVALGSLGLGLVIMAYLMIFDPYGGHGAAGWALLAFFLVALGVFLGVVYFVRRAIHRGRERG